MRIQTNDLLAVTFDGDTQPELLDVISVEERPVSIVGNYRCELETESAFHTNTGRSREGRN